MRRSRRGGLRASAALLTIVTAATGAMVRRGVTAGGPSRAVAGVDAPSAASTLHPEQGSGSHLRILLA
jgi:hypothetical protein